MTNFKLLLDRWIATISTISFLLIIIATLSPFDFSFDDEFSLQLIGTRFRHVHSIDDWLANIVLFLPLGFSLTRFLEKIGFNKSAQLLSVFIFSFSLSTTVETLQVLLPSRVPSSIDIYANCVGAFLGFLCFSHWGYTVIDRTLVPIQLFIQLRLASLPIQNLTTIILGYILITFFVTVNLQSVTSLSNWTQIYPLFLGGNGQTMSRSWQGYISEFSIAERAISEEEVAKAFSDKSLSSVVDRSLVASYHLTEYSQSYPDKTQKSPNLIWQGETSQNASKVGVFLDDDHWLETEAPVASINRSLRKSSQFTFNIILATTDTKITGMVPIISLSSLDTDRHNFAIVQNGANLVFRLRTSATGNQGTRPELIVPNVFLDTEFHHVIVTYGDSILRVYIDTAQNVSSFELNPGIVLFQKMLPLDRLNNVGLVVSKFLYYGFLFIPLGNLIGLIVTFTQRRLIYRIVLTVEAVLLSPLLLELLLAFKRGKNVDLESVLLGAMIVFSATIMTCILSCVPVRRLSL
ncbi:MAG: hypothetical protein HC769_00855 [Cyanobacteria bacterium CRU_2_1]|nr:hypothetical protein [Cyanobacteria bacterium CRU_2_1]